MEIKCSSVEKNILKFFQIYLQIVKKKNIKLQTSKESLLQGVDHELNRVKNFPKNLKFFKLFNL